MMNLDSIKFVLTLLCAQLLIIILFIEFTSYEEQANASDSKWGGLKPEKNSVNRLHPGNITFTIKIHYGRNQTC